MIRLYIPRKEEGREIISIEEYHKWTKVVALVSSKDTIYVAKSKTLVKKNIKKKEEFRKKIPKEKQNRVMESSRGAQGSLRQKILGIQSSKSKLERQNLSHSSSRLRPRLEY